MQGGTSPWPIERAGRAQSDLVDLAGNDLGVAAGKEFPSHTLVIKGAVVLLSVAVGGTVDVSTAAGEAGVSNALVALEATVGVFLLGGISFIPCSCSCSDRGRGLLDGGLRSLGGRRRHGRGVWMRKYSGRQVSSYLCGHGLRSGPSLSVRLAIAVALAAHFRACRVPV